MKKCTLILALFTFSFQMANAQWWGSNKKIKGNGEQTTQNRSVSEYDQVSLQGFMDVELVSGREGELQVEAESNLMEYIITEVVNGNLRISIEKGVNLSPSRNRDIKITVPIEDLHAVSLSGSGDIYSSNEIRSETFEVQVNGSGDINLRINAQKLEGNVVGSGDLVLAGEVEDFECMVTGSGDIDASSLKSRNASASVSGSGDIAVHATQRLISRVTGSGDIRFSGNPQKQDFKTSGSGTISAN